MMDARLVSAVRLASAMAASAARADAASPEPPRTHFAHPVEAGCQQLNGTYKGADRIRDLYYRVARPDRHWRAAPIHQAARLAWISPRSTSASAICTAFRAAPLRRLSETHQKARPFGTVGSRRRRET